MTTEWRKEGRLVQALPIVEAVRPGEGYEKEEGHPTEMSHIFIVENVRAFYFSHTAACEWNDTIWLLAYGRI